MASGKKKNNRQTNYYDPSYHAISSRRFLFLFCAGEKKKVQKVSGKVGKIN
jgi:hypothetical protein